MGTESDVLPFYFSFLILRVYILVFRMYYELTIELEVHGGLLGYEKL